jgi:Tol biopolymer transport system component/DNA-binding winged helix-turn-helix (wHTH) protein
MRRNTAEDGYLNVKKVISECRRGYLAVVRRSSGNHLILMIFSRDSGRPSDTIHKCTPTKRQHKRPTIRRIHRSSAEDIMDGNGSDRVQFGPFEADLRTHELWKFGTRIRLVGQPFEVLSILLSRPGELVTREELRGRLWPGDTFVDFNHGLNAAVNKLRDALSDSADAPRYVETLPRRGYRFIAMVKKPVPVVIAAEAVQLKSGPASPPSPPPVSIPEEPSSVFAAKSSKRGWRFYFAVVGTLLFLMFAASILFKNVWSNQDRGDANSSGQRIRTLTNLADETSEPAFSSDGNYIAFRREGLRPEESGIFAKAIGSDQLAQLTKNSDDCCPAWSPDGRSIAFSRFANREFGIYVVPFSREQERQLSSPTGVHLVALAASERKIYSNGMTPRRGDLSWSPDGKTISFGGSASIFLLSLEDSTARRLTEPPPLSEDWGPTFSADGQKVVFVRSHETGFPAEIMSIPTSGGETTRIAAEQARIIGPPQWSSDGRSIIFSSDRGSHPGIWRVSTEVRDSAVQINDNGWYPAVSRKGYRLAYQRLTRGLNIWQMDLSSPGREEQILVPSTSETDQGPGPQFSPDGKKLAYMSDRSGSMEIWVSNRDGSNPFQLTAVGGAGTPRWSPNSQAVAFDAKGRRGSAIYAASLQGVGGPRMLVPDDNANVCPSWSGDGRWVYFASHRSGDWQVWKVAAQGGAPAQITLHGGHAPLESFDGRYIYYAKTPYANPDVWQVPVEGGAERLLSPLVRPSTWASWSVVQRGILFAGPSGNGRPVLGLFDSATRRVMNVGALDGVPFWLGATRDGTSVVFDRPGWEQAQIMLVENFR